MREILIAMKRRIHRRAGKLIQANRLTNTNQEMYDVIGVNSKTGQIIKLGQVTVVEEAKRLKAEQYRDGFKYYVLEDNSVLLELE